jgi:hypothetical protein
MSQQLTTAVAVVGIDIGKNSFHVVGLDERGAIVLRYQGDDVADRSFATGAIKTLRPRMSPSPLKRLSLAGKQNVAKCQTRKCFSEDVGNFPN